MATMPKVPRRLLTADELASLHAQEFWTVEEVAAVLRVGPGFVRTAIHRGTIPCMRAGMRMLIPRRRFMQALEAGALMPDAPEADAEIVRLPT